MSKLGPIPHVYARILFLRPTPNNGRTVHLDDGTSFALAPSAEPTFRKMKDRDFVLIDLRNWHGKDPVGHVHVYRARTDARGMNDVTGFDIGALTYLSSPALSKR